MTDADPTLWRTASVVTLAIGCWATAVVPPYIGSLTFLFLAMVLAVAPANVVFSGFHSRAMWLVFGGLVLGLAVRHAELDVRLVRNLITRLPRGYLTLLYGIFFVGFALAFLIPAAWGRVALLVPIVLALADSLGFEPDSRGRPGLVLAATMGTLVPAFAILPANVPNMGLYGAVESIYGIQFSYWAYLKLNFPVLGSAALLVYPALIGRLFPDAARYPGRHQAPAPWRNAELRLTLILLAALVLWITDTLHGVSPAWVALGAALLCVAPKVGIMPPATVTRDLDYGPLLFLAGTIGLGAVATQNGLGSLIAGQLLTILGLAAGADVSNYAVITGIGVVVGMITTLPAQPSIMAPLAQTMADASGWSLTGVLMTSVASWMIFPFPYQAPPLVIAVALGQLRLLDVFRLLACYFLFGVLVMLPLHFVWGRWLGFFTAAG